MRFVVLECILIGLCMSTVDDLSVNAPELPSCHCVKYRYHPECGRGIVL
ncbi:hypothetical protein DSUL_100076 [Desulfovibrionales bacterium]